MSSGINPQNIALFCSLLVNVIFIMLYCTDLVSIIQLKRDNERTLNLDKRITDLETTVILLTSLIEYTAWDDKNGAKRCLHALNINILEED